MLGWPSWHCKINRDRQVVVGAVEGMGRRPTRSSINRHVITERYSIIASSRSHDGIYRHRSVHTVVVVLWNTLGNNECVAVLSVPYEQKERKVSANKRN